MLCSHLSCRIIFLSNTDYSMYFVYRGFLLLSYTNNALSNEFSKMRWVPHTSYPIHQQFQFQALSLHDQLFPCLIKSSRSPSIFWMVYVVFSFLGIQSYQYCVFTYWNILNEHLSCTWNHLFPGTKSFMNHGFHPQSKTRVTISVRIRFCCEKQKKKKKKSFINKYATKYIKDVTVLCKF